MDPTIRLATQSDIKVIVDFSRQLNFVTAACRALGINALHLEVDRANTAAQGLYRKFGFADHDRILMSKWASR